MQLHKLQQSSTIIPFIPLNKSDERFFIQTMIANLEYSGPLNTKMLFSFIKDELTQKTYIEDIRDAIQIQDFFLQSNISLDSIAIIFWSFEESSDLMVLKDAIQFWNEIFYPTSDDAWIIIIPSINKVILFTHYGEIST